MKIPTWVTFEKEVDVEVSIDDMVTAISKRPEGDWLPDWLSGISSALKFIIAMPQGLIAEKMSTSSRATVALHLSEQLRRFELKPPLRRFRHRKGSSYTELHRGVLEADLTPVVVYQDSDGTVWVRPVVEFDDGRFTEVVQEVKHGD